MSEIVESGKTVGDFLLAQKKYPDSYIGFEINRANISIPSAEVANGFASKVEYDPIEAERPMPWQLKRFEVGDPVIWFSVDTAPADELDAWERRWVDGIMARRRKAEAA